MYLFGTYYQEVSKALDFETQNDMPDQTVTAGAPVRGLLIVYGFWVDSYQCFVFTCGVLCCSNADHTLIFLTLQQSTPWKKVTIKSSLKVHVTGCELNITLNRTAETLKESVLSLFLVTTLSKYWEF